MTDATYLPALRPTMRFDLRTVFSSEPLFAAVGFVLLVSMVVTGFASQIDPRVLNGENVWLKPMKFQFALSVYLFTLAFFARYLPADLPKRLSYRVFAAAVVFAVVAEMVWIGGAAAFGVASHYNESSPAMLLIYNIMGVFAVLITFATLVYGVAIALNRDVTLQPDIKLSLALGLILTFVLTIVAAGALSANPGGPLVGLPVEDARVPVLGWSREVGDLRVSHFFATHAMHIIPAAALLAAWFLPWQKRTAAVWAVSVVFTLFVLGTFVQALFGRPLIAI